MRAYVYVCFPLAGVQSGASEDPAFIDVPLVVGVVSNCKPQNFSSSQNANSAQT